MTPTNQDEIKRARQIFNNKKGLQDFNFFAEKGIDYFVNWFTGLPKVCCYCGISESVMQEVFESRLKTKRRRGRSLELERMDAESNLYTEDNCALACYFCNNHKSDIITPEDHRQYFAGPIRQYIEFKHRTDRIVTDAQTNFVYVSDLLKVRHPGFFSRFANALSSTNVPFDILPATKDIWAVDFMPVQTRENKFIQFTYLPGYLQTAKYRRTVTDPSLVCDQLGISAIPSDLVIDGGNIVRSATKVIMTSRVFKDNAQYPPLDLANKIERLLDAELIVIPEEPGELFGHADGMVRFLDERNVLINDYKDESALYFTELKMSLRNAGLSLIEVPYHPCGHSSQLDATGIYINYLHTRGVIFIPVFGIADDDLALKRFEEVFPNQKIVPVVASEVAKDGGVLNCITWNIYKEGDTAGISA